MATRSGSCTWISRCLSISRLWKPPWLRDAPNEQGQFWAYHDALFADSPGLSTVALKTTAAQLGLDPLTFDRCLDERKYEDAVVADRTQGERAGVRGTPYFIVGSHGMDGAQPASSFESAIDEQLRSR